MQAKASAVSIVVGMYMIYVTQMRKKALIMPIYEYICKRCHTKIEVIQKMSDEPLTECEQMVESLGKRFVKCRGKLKKIISKSSFHLKGMGWGKDA